VVLAALAPAAMLLLDPGGLFPFGPAKWLAVSTLVPAGAALLFARRPLRWERRPTLAVGALVVAMVLAAPVGEEGLYAWIGTPERHLGVLAWVLVAVAFVAGQSLGADDRVLVARGVVVAGPGVGVAACVEAVGIGPDVLDAGSRLGSTFGSPAYLGAASCLLLPIAAAMALDRHGARAWRVSAAVAAAGVSVAVVGSGARAAWLGLAVAAVVVGLVRRPRVRPALVLAALALAAVVVVISPVGARITATFDADAPGGQGRVDEWRVATGVLTEHPLTGVGPEGYRVAFAAGVDRGYERAHGRDPLPDRAHSAPLDIALAGGPLGLLAWVAVLVAMAPSVRRALRSSDAVLVGTAVALVAYVVAELLLFPLAELEPVVALLAGTVVATGVRVTDRTVGQAHTGRTLVLPRAAPALLALVAVVALAAGGLDLAADRHAHAAIDALRAGDTADAVDHARTAVDRRPDILRNHLLLAAALEADDRGIVVALAAVDDALDLSPGDPVAQRRRAELLVRRAAATLVPDHAADARTYLEARLADDPHNATLQLLAGNAARLAGDVDAARTHWRRAADLAPRSPVPLVNLLQLELERVVAPTGDGTG
jgi:Flp pilus assembly protein TadD